jgi:hypothetical protein
MVNAAVTLKPARRPPPRKEQSEQDRDHAEYHFESTLVGAQRTSQAPKKCTETDENDREAKHKGK